MRRGVGLALCLALLAAGCDGGSEGAGDGSAGTGSGDGTETPDPGQTGTSGSGAPVSEPDGGPPRVAPSPADTVRVQFGTVADIEAFFEEIEYSPRTWQAGVRELPRFYVTDITSRWRDETVPEIDVQAKKRIFFRAMAPLALRANELIRAERARLEWLAESNAAAEGATDADWEWLVKVASDYRIEIPPRGSPPEAWEDARREAFLRVDEIPVSLALAQAANESGWGTSRFASEGNALFGQWTFGGSGMLPQAQRASLGDYRVAAFASPLLSVIAYMRNLNSHPSYARLREARAAMRAAGEPLDGWELAGALDSYSERGQDYVDEIRSMISFNGLAEADVTTLAPGPVYLVVNPAPAGTASDPTAVSGDPQPGGTP